MEIYYLLLGGLLIILGVLIVTFYYKLKKGEKGGLSFKLLTGGYGFIIIGFGIIIKEFF
jgi:hypothetical protein